jgi:uncharacterized protein YjbI with pentapeptide repeats
MAGIFRWDNGELIPGTEGITPGRRIDLSSWNTGSHSLRFADFSRQRLWEAKFNLSWLDRARFSDANLARADFTESTLAGANLTGAILSSANLYF